jgi:hypothetical protein
VSSLVAFALGGQNPVDPEPVPDLPHFQTWDAVLDGFAPGFNPVSERFPRPPGVFTADVVHGSEATIHPTFAVVLELWVECSSDRRGVECSSHRLFSDRPRNRNL